MQTILNLKIMLLLILNNSFIYIYNKYSSFMIRLLIIKKIKLLIIQKY